MKYRDRKWGLKQWRESRGFSQREAAAFLGMLPANYNKVEKHGRVPQADTLRRIVHLTGVSADTLIGVGE